MMQSRREFLRMSAVVGAATVATACTPSAPAPAPEPTAPPAGVVAPTTAPGAQPPLEVASRYHESPLLAERVARGELPPVEERLPENPYVILGLDGIGNYGGTWRLQKSGQADGTARSQVLNRGLTTVDQTMQLKTYMAESFDVSEDATTWTFHLRKGLRWSDGAPLTSEDYRFWYEDLVSNREYTANHPRWLASVVDGEVVPAQFTAADDYTISFKFARPAGLFVYQGSIVLSGVVMAPGHFLKQFHPDYGDRAEIDRLVAGNTSWDTWVQLMTDKNNVNLTIERPTHEPWVNANVFSDEVVKLERNPYFWEVDTEGNQLPYIDYLQFRDFTSGEVAVLRAVNGETDCQARHLGFDSYTVFKENEASGDYYTQVWRRTGVFGTHFNMTTKNERLAELFKERDFRIAVSLSVNRDDMRELLYDGFATNMQYCPPADSPYHYPKLANAYIEYDPDRANALLDGLGYTARDGDGYRLFKDGSGDRITFTSLGGAGDAPPAELLLIDYFHDIGLNMVYRGVDRALSIQLINSNEVEMRTTIMDRNLVPLADPSIWVKSTGPAERPMFAAWSTWFVDPNSPIAERPPDGHWVWDIWAAWEELQQAATDDAQKTAWFKIMDIWAEELPSQGMIGDLPQPCIVKNGFKGIHEGYGWDCCSTVYEHIIDNSTWYWDDPSKHMVY